MGNCALLGFYQSERSFHQGTVSGFLLGVGGVVLLSFVLFFCLYPAARRAWSKRGVNSFVWENSKMLSK